MRNFSLLLSEDNDATAGYEPHSDLPGAGRAVLVIDDHIFCSKLMSRLLKRAGFRVMLVESVHSAMTMLSTGNFDALVCNVHMVRPGVAARMTSIPLVLTTPRKIEDHDEDFDDIDADDVSLCGDVVDAVLEALWEA
jgi:CheY-like chemotaxis protein